MSLYQLTLEYIKTGRAMSFLTGSPFIWDETKGCFVFNSKMYRVIRRLSLLCLSFHLLQILMELYNLSGEKSGMGDAAIFGPFFIMAVFLIVHYTESMIAGQNIFQGFMNRLVKLQSSVQDSPEDKLTLDIAKCICLIIHEGLMKVSPFVLGSAAVAFPTMYVNLICYPPGRYLIQLIKFLIPNEVVGMLVSALLIFVFNGWAWLLIMKLTAIIIIQAIIGTVGVTQLIKHELR